MKQKVSVLIPLYNHEKYIREAIKSVQNQSVSVFEIIVIDDGSKDESGKIVVEMAKNDDRIKYFYQENAGAHSTINRLIEISTGDFISILNSDDVFKKDKIERCLEIIKKDENVEVIFGGVDFIGSDSCILTKGVPVEWQKRGSEFLEKSKLFALSILNENIISTTSNIFFKKSIIKEKNKFYPLRYCHDLDFIMECVKSGKYYFDNKNIHISYRYHESNTLKENIDDIRLEIAAVISVALVEFRNEITEGSDNFKYLSEFLNNKNFSNVIICLMMLYLESQDKDKFYSYIYQKKNKEKLYVFLT